MNSWNMRTHEVAFLLNPAFCGRVLYSTIKTYNDKTCRAFPFPLIYLILPLVLHKETRININSRTQLQLWIQRYPQLLIDFPQRARELVPITNESVEFLLQTGKILLTSNGELEISPASKTLSKTKFVDDEISECLKKGEHIAKWFATAGKEYKVIAEEAEVTVVIPYDETAEKAIDILEDRFALMSDQKKAVRTLQQYSVGISEHLLRELGRAVHKINDMEIHVLSSDYYDKKEGVLEEPRNRFLNF